MEEGGEGEMAEIIALPLVQVRGHDWHVWFARDTPDATGLYDPFLIGLATTLIDAFKLVGSLRALGEWAGVPFRQWFEREILGLDEDLVSSLKYGVYLNQNLCNSRLPFRVLLFSA
jgi:hypothetical protein